MKIILLADYYSNYLEDFYKKNDIDNLTYNEHLEFLLNDYFGSFVSYYRHFKNIGHDVKLIIGNDYRLQKKWLNEETINLESNSRNKQKIVFMQIESFNPDIFFMGSMFDYYGDFLYKISNITKNIFTWISCPYNKNLDFSNIKCIISSSELFIQEFKIMQLQSEQLKAAFDPEILNYLKRNDDLKEELSFIGGLNDKIHSFRYNSLCNLIENGFQISLYGYGLKENSLLQKYYNGEVWGIKMYEKLANSNISLNFHIDVANGFVGNMRVYEATGCGSLLFTEYSENLNTIFEVDKEIIAYRSLDELKQKIIYFQSNKEEAKEIALRGQKKTLEKHSYTVRIKEFENILYKYME